MLTIPIGQGCEVARSYMRRAFGLISVNVRCSCGVYPKRLFSVIGPHFPWGSIAIGISTALASRMPPITLSPGMARPVAGSLSPDLFNFFRSRDCKCCLAAAVTDSITFTRGPETGEGETGGTIVTSHPTVSNGQVEGASGECIGSTSKDTSSGFTPGWSWTRCGFSTSTLAVGRM